MSPRRGPATAVEPDRLARAGLSRVFEPDRQVWTLVEQLGAAELWERLCSGGRGLPDRLVATSGPRLAEAQPETDFTAAARCGARLVCPGDAEWPVGADIVAGRYPPPIALWARGPLDLGAAVDRSVAVVGSRAATDYGEYVAADLGSGLADRGWTVVSGGAYGIDGAAHRGALAAGGTTIAVLACGVDVAYPKGHRALLDRIAAEGLVVSEWAPGCAPQRLRFLVRNRVIAAITRGTVVVEAAHRSGSLSTARYARDLLRPVMAVPGPVTSALSTGTHQLITNDCASLVTGADGVMEMVGSIGDDLADPPESPVTKRDELAPVLARVLDAVPARNTAAAARIAVTAGVAAPEALGALGVLAGKGLAEERDGGWTLVR
jgi:DNA processing protein